MQSISEKASAAAMLLCGTLYEPHFPRLLVEEIDGTRWEIDDTYCPKLAALSARGLAWAQGNYCLGSVLGAVIDPCTLTPPAQRPALCLQATANSIELHACGRTCLALCAARHATSLMVCGRI